MKYTVAKPQGSGRVKCKNLRGVISKHAPSYCKTQEHKEEGTPHEVNIQFMYSEHEALPVIKENASEKKPKNKLKKKVSFNFCTFYIN